MNYSKIQWLHSDPEEPTFFLIEYGDDGYETRKVVIYSDGGMKFSSDDLSSPGEFTSEGPMPPASEIAADPGLVVHSLDAEEFEAAWLAATTGRRCDFRD
jgi:hypothetical protein